MKSVANDLLHHNSKLIQIFPVNYHDDIIKNLKSIHKILDENIDCYILKLRLLRKYIFKIFNILEKVDYNSLNKNEKYIYFHVNLWKKVVRDVYFFDGYDSGFEDY